MQYVLWPISVPIMVGSKFIDLCDIKKVFQFLIYVPKGVDKEKDVLLYDETGKLVSLVKNKTLF